MKRLLLFLLFAACSEVLVKEQAVEHQHSFAGCIQNKDGSITYSYEHKDQQWLRTCLANCTACSSTLTVPAGSVPEEDIPKYWKEFWK